MSDIPRVAIITRTKDRPLLLERAIQSIHKQTYSDFVQVIINDAGDTHAVDELVKKYHDQIRGRAKVIHNTKSRGMEAATNKAIRSVASEFIAIHDDDDSWHPEFLQRTVRLLDEQQAMGVVVRTDKVIEEVVDASGFVKRLKAERWMPDVKAINLYRQCIDNQLTPITFIYRRTALDKIGYYDETLPVLGDWDFGIRFLREYDVEYLDPGFSLANYHHREFKKHSANNNSFGSGTEKHRYYSNKLMNKHLRIELAEGRLGVGYIMSKLRYDQSNLATMIRRLLPSFVSKRLKRRVQN